MTPSLYTTCVLLTLLAVGAVFGGLRFRAENLNSVDGDDFVQHFSVSEQVKADTDGLSKPEPEVYMNATELITSKGYPCENYYVTTEDGWVLNLQRIPRGRNEIDSSNSSKPVVLLQHGLFGSSTNYIDNPANQSLGFILADAGADVWLSNSRGTTYSKNNHFDSHQAQYWNYTWDDMAKYDLPATIYFILNETSASQIYYAGHSQGTTIAFAQFSEDQELASHVKHFFALAPIARIGHAKTPVRYLAPYAHNLEGFLELFGHGKFGVNPNGMGIMVGDLCQKWIAEICESVLFVACGFNYQSMNTSRVDVYVSHGDETSVMDILKWAQEINSKQFQKFDWGSPAANMRAYNQTTAPLYNPSNVKVPVMLLRGGNDWLASDVDVAWLKPQLNVSKDVYIEQYEHLDLIWAKDAPNRVYKYILDEIFPK